jgi:hypothetical protein
VIIQCLHATVSSKFSRRFLFLPSIRNVFHHVFFVNKIRTLRLLMDEDKNACRMLVLSKDKSKSTQVRYIFMLFSPFYVRIKMTIRLVMIVTLCKLVPICQPPICLTKIFMTLWRHQPFQKQPPYRDVIVTSFCNSI